MKKYEWINGNKMKFESGFATFDKHVIKHDYYILFSQITPLLF